jgi:hypothetical protein
LTISKRAVKKIGNFLPVFLAADNLNDSDVFGLDGLVGYYCAGKEVDRKRKSVEIIR